jgi:hypothetical protein
MSRKATSKAKAKYAKEKERRLVREKTPCQNICAKTPCQNAKNLEQRTNISKKSAV